jgi:hypothetical protein
VVPVVLVHAPAEVTAKSLGSVPPTVTVEKMRGGVVFITAGSLVVRVSVWDGDVVPTPTIPNDIEVGSVVMSGVVNGLTDVQ